MKNRITVAAIALVVAFLAGFVPQYVKSRRLEAELRQSRQENTGAGLRDLIALAYVQTNEKNYGLAAETSRRFFARIRDAAKQTADANQRKTLEELLQFQDNVSAKLAKADPAVMADLQDLFTKTRRATGNPSEP